jgi:hypothetical protein
MRNLILRPWPGVEDETSRARNVCSKYQWRHSVRAIHSNNLILLLLQGVDKTSARSMVTERTEEQIEGARSVRQTRPETLHTTNYNSVPLSQAKQTFPFCSIEMKLQMVSSKNKSANISNWQMIRTWQSHRRAGSWTSMASQFHPSIASSCCTILSSQRRSHSYVVSGKLTPFFILTPHPGPLYCPVKVQPALTLQLLHADLAWRTRFTGSKAFRCRNLTSEIFLNHTFHDISY